MKAVFGRWLARLADALAMVAAAPRVAVAVWPLAQMPAETWPEYTADKDAKGEG
ncbi:MAG TPA: hypothetical protein P5525_11150 [Candidatus Paceibacterota bacterium]|nr:hypothetical protein [Candidatus Paceibacterota bacterium]